MNRVFALIASTVSFFTPLLSQATEFKGGQNELSYSTAVQIHNAHIVAEWLVSKGVVDNVSAMELAMSLSEEQLSAMASALTNPLLQRAHQDIMPVKVR